MKPRYVNALYAVVMVAVTIAAAMLNFSVLSDRHLDLIDNSGIGLIAPPAATNDLGLLASPEPGAPTHLAPKPSPTD